MEKFKLKYSQGLKELSEKLDTYIQGNWFNYDFLLGKERTEITPFLAKNCLYVYFGDSNTRDRKCLSIEYAEIEDDLMIKDISFLKDSEVYSNDIMSLISSRIKGRTNEELFHLKIQKLEKRYEDSQNNIKEFEKKLIFEKEQSEFIETEINNLKNELIK